jgi:hypothetical protein
MSPPRPAQLLLAALLFGCGSAAIPAKPDRPDAAPPVDRHAPDATAAVTADTAPSVEDGTGGSPAAVTCEENVAPPPGVAALVGVRILLTYAGKPIEFGQPVALAKGTLTLTTFRFYLSDLALVRKGGQVVPVVIHGPNDRPVPYNVHLATADESEGMSFELEAPAGEYEGLSFLFGLNEACDKRDPSTSKPPLTYASQMDWPGPFGYLYLRYGARLEGVPVDSKMPDMIHMGGFPGYVFAPRVTAPGTVRVTGGPASERFVLRVDVAEILAAAGMPARNDGPIPPPPGGGIAEGDAVRQNVGNVSIFSLAPAP